MSTSKCHRQYLIPGLAQLTSSVSITNHNAAEILSSSPGNDRRLTLAAFKKLLHPPTLAEALPILDINVLKLHLPLLGWLGANESRHLHRELPIEFYRLLPTERANIPAQWVEMFN